MFLLTRITINYPASDELMTKGTETQLPSTERTNRKFRVFISTGEVSGDLQGSLLIAALYRQAQLQNMELEITALGGERMAQAGAQLIANTSAIGSVGLLESLPYVLPTLTLQRQAKAQLLANPPDLVVFIDYMGPNLGFGQFLQQRLPQIPVVYYIAPQVWVWSWNERDTQQLVKISDRILAIFPEEARYFQQRGAQVTWVGHPLLDRIQAFPGRTEARKQLKIEEGEQAVVLLPASRRQELKYLMPVMFEAAAMLQQQLPTVRFWIPLALKRYREQIEQAITTYQLNATIVEGDSQVCLAAADLAITKSGTVNLELALLKVPQVVLYRVSPLTYWVACRLFKFAIPFMSPPNLVMMQSIVPEFLQEQATAPAILTEAFALLTDIHRREKMQQDYIQMQQVLGETGVCDRSAIAILQQLSSTISP